MRSALGAKRFKMRKAELVELSFEDLSSATTLQGEGRRCERQVRRLHRQEAVSFLGPLWLYNTKVSESEAAQADRIQFARAVYPMLSQRVLAVFELP